MCNCYKPFHWETKLLFKTEKNVISSRKWVKNGNETATGEQRNVQMCVLYARCPRKRVPVYNTLRVKATQHSMLYAELSDGKMLSKVIILNGRNGNGLAKCYTMRNFCIVSFDLFSFMYLQFSHSNDFNCVIYLDSFDWHIKMGFMWKTKWLMVSYSWVKPMQGQENAIRS